ncbi:MAG: NAD(+)/NADH kinase [Theionarchaea archaeon]|nr:NAD(+)/NADH kinase [Theionarchaea archaeon]
MRIGLVSRTDKEEAIQLIKEIAEHLSDYDLYCDKDLFPFLEGNPIEEVDVLVVVGGDGTILRTVRKYCFPIVAVKMGQYGHLCELEPDNIYCLRDIVEHHAIDRRMKLEIPGMGEALNEVVVRAVAPDKVASFKVEYGDNCDIVNGDGIIVATPTGSTAYSLAAGGPVIEDRCPVFCITPICASNSVAFPKVISSDHEVTITSLDKPCHMTLDGDEPSTLSVGECITVRKSGNYAVFWRKKGT